MYFNKNSQRTISAATAHSRHTIAEVVKRAKKRISKRKQRILRKCHTLTQVSVEAIDHMPTKRKPGEIRRIIEIGKR